MALSTHYEQTARFSYLLGFGFSLLIVLCKKLPEGLSCLYDLLVVRLCIARCFLDKLVGEAHSSHFRFCKKLIVTAELYIGTTTRHVGSDGNGSELARLSDYLRFLLVLLCIEDVVLDSLLPEHIAQFLGLVNGNGTYKHGLTALIRFDNIVDESNVLAVLGLEYSVGEVDPLYRLVRGYLDNVKMIDLRELSLLSHSRTGHTGELAVQTEEVLERDGSKSLAFTLDAHAFLCLDSLMQTFIVASAVHQTTRKFVNDDDLALLVDNVLYISLHYAARLDSLIDVMSDSHIFRIGQVLKIEERLSLLYTNRGKRSRLCLFVNDVVYTLFDIFLIVVLLAVRFGYLEILHRLCKRIGSLVKISGLIALTGNDKRGSCFINEDRVHLIDDSEGVSSLHLVFLVDDHVVTKIVESKLIVRSVGYVRIVRDLSLFVGAVVLENADRQTEETIDLSHPLSVTLCKIFVDGNDVNAVACKRIKISGKSRNEGLSFTCLHFAYAASVEYDAADDLNAEVLHSENAP